MVTINKQKIKQELVVFLRNQNIFTIAQRGVTTTTYTETLANAASATISVTNVKNIRSISVAAVSLVFGTDYEVDYGTGKTGSNCVITFTANQTGALSVSYDYGTDKIWPDYPRDDLSISSYPRIAVDVLNIPTDAFGIGGDKFISEVNFTAVVYDNNSDNIDSYLYSIKNKFISNANNFYYLKFIKPTLTGPTISDPETKEEIMHGNQDFKSMFNVESA
jgi:hypothetical protein